MFGFLRRRHREPPASSDTEPTKGVGVWTVADHSQSKMPDAQHIVTPTGQPGTYLHSFKYAEPTEAESERAEWAALAEFNQSLAPAARYPVSAQRPSIFDKPPNPDSFPGM